MECKLLEFGSPAQRESIELRREVLRIPLGLDFDQHDLDAESDQYHVACLDDGKIVGILLLKPVGNGVLKMRQVAVSPTVQGQGIGSRMVKFSETWAREQGYRFMELHARKTAVDFYLQLQYSIAGDEFTEVGIPHLKMVKGLDKNQAI